MWFHVSTGKTTWRKCNVFGHTRHHRGIGQHFGEVLRGLKRLCSIPVVANQEHLFVDAAVPLLTWHNLEV